MITIGTLLDSDRRWREFASPPEMDPLSEDDALQEAQLLDVWIDASRSTVGLLFELRVALQLREANTGVLIARGVRELSWAAAPRSTKRTAWNVVGSQPVNHDGFALSLTTWPESRLSLRSESAAFFVCNVPGLDRIPDYLSDEESVIRANIASWHSPFLPVSAVFLDPAPRE